MPVLVTGAHRPLARRIVASLLQEGGEVRAHTSGDAATLRAAGAVVAAGAGDDEGHLEASLEHVHTVVHVGRGILARDPQDLVDEAAVLGRAAANAGVRRVVALSLPGADPAASDPLRAAQGEVERILADAPVPTVVVRVSLVDTPAVRDALGTAGLSDDELGRPVAPVRVEDLVALVVAFDRLRSSAERGHAVFAADGVATVPLGVHLERVGVRRPGTGSLVGRRMFDPARTPLLLPSLHGPWTNGSDSDLPDAWRFTGTAPGVVGPV